MRDKLERLCHHEPSQLWCLSLGTAVFGFYSHFNSVNELCLGPCLSLCPEIDPKNSLQGFRSFSICILGSILASKIQKAPLCCRIYTQKGISHLVGRVEFSINLSLGLKLTALAVRVKVLTKGKKSCYKCDLFV